MSTNPNTLVDNIMVAAGDAGMDAATQEAVSAWLEELVDLASEGQTPCTLTGNHVYSGDTYSACWACGEPEE